MKTLNLRPDGPIRLPPEVREREAVILLTDSVLTRGDVETRLRKRA